MDPGFAETAARTRFHPVRAGRAGWWAARMQNITIILQSQTGAWKVYANRHAGLPGSTIFKSTGAMPKIPITTGSFAPFLTPS